MPDAYRHADLGVLLVGDVIESGLLRYRITASVDRLGCYGEPIAIWGGRDGYWVEPVKFLREPELLQFDDYGRSMLAPSWERAGLHAETLGAA